MFELDTVAHNVWKLVSVLSHIKRSHKTKVIILLRWAFRLIPSLTLNTVNRVCENHWSQAPHTRQNNSDDASCCLLSRLIIKKLQSLHLHVKGPTTFLIQWLWFKVLKMCLLPVHRKQRNVLLSWRGASFVFTLLQLQNVSKYLNFKSVCKEQNLSVKNTNNLLLKVSVMDGCVELLLARLERYP